LPPAGKQTNIKNKSPQFGNPNRKALTMGAEEGGKKEKGEPKAKKQNETKKYGPKRIHLNRTRQAKKKKTQHHIKKRN